MKIYKSTLLVVAVLYLSACGIIYATQRSLLFPAKYAEKVPVSWQPTAGDSASQAFINGSCGKLNVAIWRIHNAKGTIMMSHGNGESLASINNYANAFLNLGYNLMAWDYPSYGQSTDCWFSQNNLLSDAENAYQWLSTQEKPEKIFIFGYSIGTGVALSVAAHHQENPVFLVAAYDSLTNVAKENMSALLPIQWMMRYPMETAPFVANMHQHIYIIHGTEDQLIHPDRANKLIEQAKGQASIEWVKGAGHTDDKLFEYRNLWLKRLLP